MQGPELGVQPDDIEAPGVAREPQQEVLDNKNVRLQSEMHIKDQHNCSYMVEVVIWFFCVCQVIVQRVHIDGLCRTKDDLLTHEISGIFEAKNLIDVCSRCCHSCRQTVAVVKAVFCYAGDAEVPRSSTATLASGNLQESGSGHRHLTRYHQVMPHLRPRPFSPNNTYLLPEEARMRFPTAWM